MRARRAPAAQPLRPARIPGRPACGRGRAAPGHAAPAPGHRTAGVVEIHLAKGSGAAGPRDAPGPARGRRASCVVLPRARCGRRRVSAHAAGSGAAGVARVPSEPRCPGMSPADTTRRLTRGGEGSPRRGRPGERRRGRYVASAPPSPPASSSNTRSRGIRSGMSRVTISQTASSSITPYPWMIRFLVSTMPRHGTS